MKSLKPLSNEQCGTLYAIASGLCYGLLGYFGMSIIQANLSIANTTFWRFFISTGVIALILLPSKYKALLANKREALKVMLYGMIFYSPGAMAFFVSSQYIGTGLAIVIFFTFPVMVMLINWYFFGTRISLIYYIAVVMIVIGLVLLVDKSKLQSDIIGVTLSFLSAASYAIYVVVSKRCFLAPLPATFMLSMGSMMTSFLYAYIEGSFIIPNHINIWLDILGIGIICTAIPILLLLQGLKYISAEKVSILSVLEPVSIVLVGIALLGETITAIQSFGIIIILAGAMITIATQK